MAKIRDSVAGAMAQIKKEIKGTADVYERIGLKIENFGVRITIEKLWPLMIDFKIKDK